MYEGDTPNAERRAAALSLDRELLRELLGQEELRELIDPEALEEVERDLQRLSERTQAVNADGLHDILRAVGDLTLAEAEARTHRGASAKRMLDVLKAGPCTTGNLCARFPELDRTTVLQHLRVLEDADLVIGRRVGRERHLTLAPLPIKRIFDRWIGEYARAAVELLDDLDSN